MKILTDVEFAVLTRPERGVIGDSRHRVSKELFAVGLMTSVTVSPPFVEGYKANNRGDVAARAHIAFLLSVSKVNS